MSTRDGTCHFVSRAAAIRYYARQGIDAHGVDEKLKMGEIALGAPAPRAGHRAVIEPSEGRYFMEEDHSEPTWENQLWQARKKLQEKGRDALDNPNGMIGRTCKCGTCYCCAAAFVVAEYDKADGGAALKRQVCDALAAWIRKRPGLNPRDYYNTFDRGETLKVGLAAYCRTQRELGRDKRDAETLLDVVRNRDSITIEMLLEASQQAYAGRLTLTPGVADVIEYTGGQDPTTEYRAAAASVLAYAIRHTAIREARAREEEVTGDWVRSHFRKEFGSALQRRWFN